MTETDILKSILAELRKPEIPQNFQWWTTKDIATAIGYAEAVVRDRITHLPDFPKPARITGLGKNKDSLGKPRWKAIDVVKWMEKQKEKAA